MLPAQSFSPVDRGAIVSASRNSPLAPLTQKPPQRTAEALWFRCPAGDLRSGTRHGAGYFSVCLLEKSDFAGARFGEAAGEGVVAEPDGAVLPAAGVLLFSAPARQKTRSLPGSQALASQGLVIGPAFTDSTLSLAESPAAKAAEMRARIASRDIIRVCLRVNGRQN